MYFQKFPVMMILIRLIFISLLVHTIFIPCYNCGDPKEIAAFSSESQHEKHEDKAVAQEAHQYIISIAIKNSDGNDITYEWQNDPEERFFARIKDSAAEEDVEFIKKFREFAANPNHKRGSSWPTYGIKDVLRIYYGIKIEYIPAKLKKFEQGGFVRFQHPVKEFGITAQKGQKMTIWKLIHLLNKHDGLWGIQDTEHDTSKILFDSFFNAHVMAALALPVPNKNGREQKPVEIARFHTNSSGLNLYSKQKNQNYTVDKDLHEHPHDLTVIRTGAYIKQEFVPRLLTRKLTMDEIKQIGLDVIAKNGGKWNLKTFNCQHFVYAFVNAIKDDKTEIDLRNFDAWPKYMRLLDLHVFYKMDKTFCFKKMLNREFNIAEYVNKDKQLRKMYGPKA